MRTWLPVLLTRFVLCFAIVFLFTDAAGSTAATDEAAKVEGAAATVDENPQVTPKLSDQPEERKETTNSVGMRFLRIPSGTFLMGSPATEKGRRTNETQHQVTLTRPFFMGRTEVTQGQWRKVMGTEPWKGKPYVQEGDDYPAVYIRWYDAVLLCRKLADKEGRTYRLPTEAEWEYACRGGTTTAFSFGDDEGQLSDYAWWGGFFGNGNAEGEWYAHLVAQKRSNAFGLYDMHGNVWEWCSDLYGDYPSTPVTDPRGAYGRSTHLMRGGSWYDGPDYIRCADRFGNSPDDSRSGVGFRLVLE